MTKSTTFRLRNFTIDHVTSNARLNGHTLANCRLNSRIEKNKNGWKKNTTYRLISR